MRDLARQIRVVKQALAMDRAILEIIQAGNHPSEHEATRMVAMAARKTLLAKLELMRASSSG